MNGYHQYPKDTSAMQFNNGHVNGFNTNSFPSSSSNPYPDFQASAASNQYANNMDMRQPLSQSGHGMSNQNQWPLYPQNSMTQTQMHNPQPPQQQFNLPWSGQMQNQSFTNGAGGMGMGMNGFNVSFLPQQVLHDAVANSAPVQKSDEDLLYRALISWHTKNGSYKDALNSLHGRNGHSASLWKDYYLDHKFRIDRDISVYINSHNPQMNYQRPQVKVVTAKKPSMDSFKVESSPVASSSTLPHPSVQQGRQQSRQRKSSTPVSATSTVPTIGRRSTINSLTTHTAVFDRHLPPPHADLKIPDPPSRSPTPPTRVVPQGRGNKFTPEDKDFFLKFILRRLKEDPSLSRNDLCELLAEKARAPHHSSQSWYSYWSNNHDMPDKILAAARGDSLTDEDESEEEKKPSTRPRPKYRDLTTSEEEDDDEEEEEEEEEDAEGDDDIEEENDDDLVIPPFDESSMGPKGGPFTEADLAITARHIATFDDFGAASFQEKWVPFGEKYTQRSPKAWAEYYRRNEIALERLARKIRRQNEANGQSSGQATGKRKLDSESDEGSAERSKHAKIES
ncbi:uncharacterized protein ARMOST_08922 [Armillaria ostoyae]|uniref:Uncharacterized protein n=1 Tax=Armillaria ostoyae TaxID=47428 RepID=A0A284RA02_ARMOS|nr:uncharacterized protein ARMOST_08922 [Armillaria ostoyae]